MNTPRWQVNDWWQLHFEQESIAAPQPTVARLLKRWVVDGIEPVHDYPCYRVRCTLREDSPDSTEWWGAGQTFYFSLRDLSLVKCETVFKVAGEVRPEVLLRPPGTAMGEIDVLRGWPVFPLVDGQKLNTATLPQFYRPDEQLVKITESQGAASGYGGYQAVNTLNSAGASSGNQAAPKVLYRVRLQDSELDHGGVIHYWRQDKPFWLYAKSVRGQRNYGYLGATSWDVVPVEWVRQVLKAGESTWKVLNVAVVPTPAAWRGKLSTYSRVVEASVELKPGTRSKVWLARTEADTVVEPKNQVEEVNAPGVKLVRLFLGQNYQVIHDANSTPPVVVEPLKSVFAKSPFAPTEPAFQPPLEE